MNIKKKYIIMFIHLREIKHLREHKRKLFSLTYVQSYNYN